jgi:hypothetical protein
MEIMRCGVSCLLAPAARVNNLRHISTPQNFYPSGKDVRLSSSQQSIRTEVALQMNRFTLLATLLVATSAKLLVGCSSAQSHTKVPVPGTIEIETAAGGKESYLAAPTVAQAGKDFQITIHTYGGGCESKGGEEVTVSENTATVRVYDFTTATSLSSVCTLPLLIFEHAVTLRFTKPGVATIKIVGQREVNSSIWRKRSFVREHRLMVTP